jgi:hypothetical protein
MKAITTVAAILAMCGSAMAQWTDDFNRPDGPLGGPWNVLTGTWAIQSNQGAHTSTSSNELIQHNTANAGYSSVVAKLDVFGPGTSSQFSALVIGLGTYPVDAIMVKLQNQAGVPGFSHIGIYHRTSATGWGAWTGTGTGFAALTTPGFTSARLTVTFPNPDTVQADIDTNFDGIPDETHMKTGISAFAANIGNGLGISAWGNTALFDNFDATGMPTPPINDPCASAFTLAEGPTNGTTVLATNDGTSSCDATGNDVWYSFTADGFGGDATFDTCGSAGDFVLSVYDVCGGTLLGCDDNSAACGSNAAEVALTLNPNQNVLVRVSDKGVSGPFTLNTDYAPNVPGQCNGSTLSTTFVSNNGGSAGGAVLFDMNVTKVGGITVSQLQTNTSLASGGVFGMDVYTVPTTYVGNENNMAAWTLMASGSGLSLGTDQPSLVEFPDFPLAQGSYGVALVISGASHRYTNGTGGNQNFSNADLALTLGGAKNVPWTGSTFTPRVWNGTVIYDCSSGPVTYCTAGTTSSGCVPSISASAHPSASHANGCMVTAVNVEGQKNGIVFYGFAQNAQPWSPSSTSFLCIKPPTVRTPPQVSGGTIGACDGTLSLDFDLYTMTNTINLSTGVPWAAGDVVDFQAWFRDPPAPKTTNLTDAVEVVFVP